LCLVTIAAIDGLVASRLEGNLSFVATIGARCAVHLASFAWGATAATAVAAAIFARIAARGTAAGGIRQPVALVKFLFTNSEDKFLVTIAAN